MMNVSNFIIEDKEKVHWTDLHLDKNSRIALEQLLSEHSHIELLKQYELPVNNKVIFHGSSGCGKTTTAKAIAEKLGKKMHIINLSTIVSSRIGETSQNLKMIFDKAKMENGVLFLDEFDQIGKARSNNERDVGEMRRLVNTLIQLIDYLPERSLLIAATNQIEIIDKALIRRFQCVVRYRMPNNKELDNYYDTLLSRFPEDLKRIRRKYKVSYAEAKDYAYTALKSLIITNSQNKIIPTE